MNVGYTYRSRVSPDAAGRTLLAHLADTYAHSPREAWATRLANGEIALDDVRASGDEVLRPGQAIAWHRPPWHEPEVPLTYEVLFEDASLLVVAKPAGLPTMPAGGFLEHTLWTCVRRAHGDVHPVHRLGRGTSGLVVFARTSSAAAAMAARWHDRATKDYRALVTGTPAWSSQTIETPIGLVDHPRLGTVHAASVTGRHARSEARVVERREAATLCDVRIDTGRPHQIRIHLAVVGHPLLGDPLYAVGGVPRAIDPGLPGDGGYWLHAHRLVLPHPETGHALTLTAEPPEILAASGDVGR